MTLEFNQAEESVISIDNVIGNIDLSLSVESSSVEAMPVDVVLSSSNELNIEVVLDNQEVPLSVVIEPQMALEVAITTNDSIDFTVDVNTDTNKGDKGDTGEAGPQGPRGPRGEKGDRGDVGATGVTGPAGSTGLDGVKGDKGDKGDLGLTGAKGDKGDQGNQGFKGDKGDTGPAGVKGDQGVQGIQGQDGLTTSVNGVTQIDGNVTLTKSDIGLGNVDDTSDLNKPISTATQSALDLKLGLNTPITAGSNSKITYDSNGLVLSSSKADISDITDLASALSNKLETSLKGAANGLAELDSSGFVKNTQLPSYVDDVLEYSSLSLFPVVGESGKIYIDTTTNLTYRWSGSTYALISQSLALGETSLTAYRGDRGKIAYDHSQIILGNPHNVSKADVGLSNVPNLSFSGSNTGDQTLSGLGGQPKLNGTGFVKASGTTISYDNSSYYLASNPNNYISGITKAQVESVLTGLITSHTHNYLSSFTETDPIFTAWNKSTGISITKSQVSDFPTNLSQFTNNLGNYGGWITGITSGMVTTALGYTPYNSSNPNGYINGINKAQVEAVLTGSITSHTHNYESPLTFSTGLSRVGNTITNTITQYTNAMADARVVAGITGKQNTITLGTTAQYLRGDLSLATMPTSLPASDVYTWAKQSTKPSYSWSEITSKPTVLSSFTNDLGNYGGFVTGTPWTSQGYLTSSALSPYQLASTAINTSNIGSYLSYQSNRDFPNGTLIKTDIDYSHTEGEPFLLEIVGNSYNMTTPFDIKVQGYIYANQIIAYGGISNGANFPNITVINVDGFLCFWFPRLDYWQGFTVNVNSSYSGNKKNRLVSISDSVKPANATKEIVVTIYQSYHSGNRSFVSKTGDTMSGTLDMQNNTLSNVDTIQHANARIIMHGNLHIDSYNGNAIYNQYYSHNEISNWGTTRNNGYDITGVGILSSSQVIANTFSTTGSTGSFSLVIGNGDAASYDTCTADIKTWNGFGIIGMAGNPWGDGTRTIVFDARDGKIMARGGAEFGGNVTASNFILSSDRTLKTNIQPIIKDYSRLNLVSFNFKDNLDELRFGTIAQDLLSNGYSEFVTGDKEGEYKVKYIDLIIAKLASAELRIKELEDKYGSR